MVGRNKMLVTVMGWIWKILYFLHRIFTSPSSDIHVSSVICGERSVEATTMLKSTTLFTNRTIQFHVVAEDNLHAELKTIFREWFSVKSGQVLFKLYSLHFPSGEDAEEWKRLFKPCAAQRLFLLVSIFYQYHSDLFCFVQQVRLLEQRFLLQMSSFLCCTCE